MYSSNLKNSILSIQEISEKSQKWLDKNISLKTRLYQYIDGFDDLILAIPSTVSEKYGVLPPWIYLYHEANQELDSSLLLALSGMYKESLRTLRSFIELNLLGICYFTTEDVESFTKWLKGEKETPSCRKMIRKIIENNSKIKKLEQLNWGNSVYSIYKDLSQFVHTGGHNNSFQILRDSNQLQFNEKGMDYSINKIVSTLKFLSAAWVACFPLSVKPLPLFNKFAFNGPASGFFDYGQAKKIISMFNKDKKIQNLLKKISEEDDDCNSIAEGIISMPDLEEKEIILSFENFIESIKNLEERKKFLASIKDESPEVIIAMVNARQRALLKALIPFLNSHFLNLDKNVA